MYPPADPTPLPGYPPAPADPAKGRTRNPTLRAHLAGLVILSLSLCGCAGTKWADPATWLGLGLDALQCSGDLFDGIEPAEAVAASTCLLGAGLNELEAAPVVVPESRALDIAEQMVPCATAVEAYLADPDNPALEAEARRAVRKLERVCDGR